MSFGFGFGFTKITAAIRAAFSPSSLFAANEPGVWYDPSDFSTMFQDAAGTVPVTAVEQPVGLILDKSGNGNHAYQTTATSRPVLSARVNLLTNTVFSDAVVGAPGVAPSGWTFNSTGGTIVSANDGVIVFSATNARQMIGVNVTLPANTTQTWSVRIEENPDHLPFSQLFFAVNATGAVVQFRANGIVVSASVYVPSVGDTLTITLINGATQSTPIFRIGVGTSSAVTGTAAFSRPDARGANTGVNLPPYQRVNTATGYDTAGFPHYLRFDGVDDWLVTPTITPGTDKVQVFAGVRKLNNTPGLIYGHGPNTNVTAGSFEVLSTGWSEAASRYGAALNISLLSRADSPTDFAPPRSDVLNWAFDASGSTLSDEIKLRVNGTLQTLSMSDPTQSGNFTTQIGYIGRRGDTWLPFYGHLYSLIVRFGSNLPIATIENTEKYINTKTGAY